jgi:hypothetical protein
VTKSRGINRLKWRATEQQDVELRRDFATTSTADLAARFGVHYHQVARRATTLGLRKLEEYLVSAGGRTDGVRGMGTRFQPGHRPWTAGKTLTGRIASTAFKPGQRPANYKPLGSLRINAGGYLQRKITETGYPPHDWQFVHRLVWVEAHGPIPPGHVVTFRTGRRTTDPELLTVDALELISQRELMDRNRLPPELQAISQLRGVLTRALNDRSKA